MGKQKPQHIEDENESNVILVRIHSTDIPGNFSLYSGLVRIKGVSWAFANALCHILKLDRTRKISSLKEAEIEQIVKFLKNPKVPEWLMNRKRDRETGESKHLTLTDLDLTKEWDIRRMKKIKSYKGWRHALGQPVRGQRTKAHFREKGKAVGVKKAKGGKK
ncbi:30S ribosomal protein S13 [Nanoarchaeota archaeon]